MVNNKVSLSVLLLFFIAITIIIATFRVTQD